jgi:predicted component of type VI protein secretion system
MNYRVFNIEYDTDGEAVDLAIELHFKDLDKDFSPENELADLISDQTGFCVFSFEYEQI